MPFKKLNESNQETFLRLHGDDLWELMCDTLEIDKAYTYDEAAKILWPQAQQLRICKTEKQLVRNIKFLSRNVREEYTALAISNGGRLHPDDICPLTFIVNGFML